VDAGLRAQIERILHLVERRRYAGFLQTLIDEAKKFILFARKHLEQVPQLMVPFCSGLRVKDESAAPTPERD
jgi:hypothetical protein